VSSHSVKLAKSLRELESIIALHSENVTNEYNRGVANGLLLAIKTMSDKEIAYFKKADKRKRKGVRSE